MKRSFANSAAFAGAVTGCLATATIAVAAANTTVLTVAGNTNIVRTPMTQQLQGSLCEEPAYTCKRLPYRSSGLGAAPLNEGAVLLQRMLAEQAGPTMVFAYSQGGMLATTWLQRYGDELDAERRNEISFVLVGSPQNGEGGFGPASGSKSRPGTPTDTGYTIIEVTRQYDMESDYPANKWNLLAVANAYAGFFGVHTDYTNVNLLDPNNLIKQVGGTTYVVVPTEHLPLLNPLRRLGLVTMANNIEARWKPIIDSAYDRSGYMTLGDAWRDGVALPATLAAGAPPSVTSGDSAARSMRSVTLPVSVPAADADDADDSNSSEVPDIGAAEETSTSSGGRHRLRSVDDSTEDELEDVSETELQDASDEETPDLKTSDVDESLEREGSDEDTAGTADTGRGDHGSSSGEGAGDSAPSDTDSASE